MSTTAIFFELLLTGLQVAIWLGLVILSVLGFDWINLERMKGFEAVLAVLLLPIVYPVGVSVDYLADILFRPWERKIRKPFGLDEKETALQLLVETKDASLAMHFSYLRSRIRVCRSSALNFFFLTGASLVFTITRCRNLAGFPFRHVILLEALIGACLTMLATLAWSHVNHSFFKWVMRGYNGEASKKLKAELAKPQAGA